MIDRMTFATDPGRHTTLLSGLPDAVAALGEVVRNVVGGAGTPGADHATVADLLDADQLRYPGRRARGAAGPAGRWHLPGGGPADARGAAPAQAYRRGPGSVSRRTWAMPRTSWCPIARAGVGW